MADSGQYENRYRKYLQDENDVYQDPGSSFGSKIIMGALTAGGLYATGRAMIKRGDFNQVLHDTMLKAGQFRKGKVDAAVRGVRSFSQSDGLDGLGDAIKDTLAGRFSDARENLTKFSESMYDAKSVITAPIKDLKNNPPPKSRLANEDFEMRQWAADREHAVRQMGKNNISANNIQESRSLVEEAIAKTSKLDEKKQRQAMRETGFRNATMGDLIRLGEVSETDEWVQQSITSIQDAMRNKAQSQTASAKMQVKTNDDFRKMAVNEFNSRRADKDIYIDTADNVADFRDFRNTFDGFVNSLTTEFTIPIVKINPMRMFYLDQFFTNKAKPLVHISTADKKNPLVTGHNGSQQNLHMYIDGNVYKAYDLKDDRAKDGLVHIGDNFFMAEADRGPVARLVRNMSGISISEFKEPSMFDPLSKRIRYNVQSGLDIGFQDEPPGQFDLFDFTSWVPALVNKGTNKLRMEEYVHREDYLTDAFGKNADFIYMKRAKSLEEAGSYKDFLAQATAGRKNMEDVTVATLFPYGFFERLNATLNQINLGLSNKALADAPTVFGGLLLKRIAPIWAGVELWDYVQYESENLLGFQLEDQMALTYANSSIEMAKLRDNLGVTDWAKGITPLLVGGEQIADIPFLGGLLDWNDTAEETAEFYEEGEVAVRKGRWWPLGNTPYTGSNIDRFEPNWVRRTLSDYKFSEELYGSREEYFENTWMPTLRHPLAPIRHFITDPYHYEEKQYDTRPYMMTGGIPEIENFPLIGPFLNATIGQILKPQVAMHTDEWSQTPAYAVVPDNAMLASGAIMTAPTGNASDMLAGIPMEAMMGSTTATYQQEAAPVMASYVTSSGAATVMQTDDVGNIYNLLPTLNERTPASTGNFTMARFEETGPSLEAQLPDTVASAYSMLGNLHYNVGEMGGFYGFMAFSAAGEIGDEKPVIQSSSDMTGYTRQFWDNDFGGFGSDANEIFRRFLPADRKLNEINYLDNTMPEWLPGSNYFIDFQTGDPYTKVKKGEMRLPGEGYERLYDIDTEKMMQLDIGASFIGYDEQKIRDHMLQNDAIKDETLNKILDKGTAWHKKWEREMDELGVAESMEQYVKDEEVGIGGFYDLYGQHGNVLNWLRDNSTEFTYYKASGGGGAEQYEGYYEEGIRIDQLDESTQEAFYERLANYGTHALIDPKTRSDRAYENDEMHFENAQQVNFYGTQMGTDMNYLIHVNRDNPELPIKVFGFETNQALLDYSYNKVEGVRQGIRDDLDNGDLNRGNLYDMIDRYRILADVAPYSEEFRNMKSQIKNMNMTEDEMNEVRIINDQVSQRKEKVRLYPYRYQTAEVEEKFLTVDHVIDANTFMAKEFPDNPITLAGVSVSTAQDSVVAQEALGVIQKAIKEGGQVRVQIDANEDDRVKDNTYKTIDAVVYDKHGRNINKLLIDEGLGKEKENDYSSTSVYARFSPTEIKFGSAWETVAHMDTMIHTKMLQVRSPIESYERREVYGKDWQEWTDPVDDFLIPFIQNSAMHNPVVAIGLGAFIGGAFGSLKPTDIDGEKVTGRFGKVVGATLGASIMGAAVLNRMVHQAVTGERWIPERRQEERDVEEYFDVLEYIKANAMYNKYAAIALKEERFDVKEYLQENEKEGDFRQSKKKDLEEIKRRIYMAREKQLPDILRELEKVFGLKASDKKEAMSLINAEIEGISNDREMQKLGPASARAMMYKQAAEKTMYGYDAGDPVSNILAALPKKDRDYLMPFIESPERDHERILQTVPDYMKRVLQSAWGQKPDDKKELYEFMKDKPLPGADWIGWQEDVMMEDMKVKFVDNAGLDPSEFDIWDSDLQRARLIEGQAPDVLAKGVQTDPQEYARKLKEILLGYNVQGVQVNVVQSNVAGVNVDMDISQNRQDDVQALINSEGYRLF